MKKKKGLFTRYSRQDKVLLTVGYVLLGLFVVAIIVPMIYILLHPSWIQSRCRIRESPLISANGRRLPMSVS